MNLLSIRAVYIPGVLNRGADIMSRGGPRPGDWSLHPELIVHTGERTIPVLVFTEPTGGSTIRSGRLCSQPVAENALLRFSSGSADPAAPGSSPRGRAVSDSRSPRVQKRTMVSEPPAAGVKVARGSCRGERMNSSRREGRSGASQSQVNVFGSGR
ncbi:hypothetical protein ILYODFUR_032973 [Ilyodon furcidens]|uniref:Uncharacterized protein n=1 Tax=Ilyodon furcidens TaxID=33524 RepID=A0ABV0TDC1_9TELE